MIKGGKIQVSKFLISFITFSKKLINNKNDYVQDNDYTDDIREKKMKTTVMVTMLILITIQKSR